MTKPRRHPEQSPEEKAAEAARVSEGLEAADRPRRGIRSSASAERAAEQAEDPKA